MIYKLLRIFSHNYSIFMVFSSCFIEGAMEGDLSGDYIQEFIPIFRHGVSGIC